MNSTSIGTAAPQKPGLTKDPAGIRRILISDFQSANVDFVFFAAGTVAQRIRYFFQIQHEISSSFSLDQSDAEKQSA